MPTILIDKGEYQIMETPSNLLNEKFNDRYFDVVNALDEAQQIHFRNNDLLARIACSVASASPFVIGETGFGAGRIVVALMEYLRQCRLKDVHIQYNTVELYPISPDRMFSILGGFGERVGEEIATLVEAYQGIDIAVPGWHSLLLLRPFGSIHVNLWIGEALEMVQALQNPCDVWFLDGHGPKKNPSMWREELLLAIGQKTKPGGSCSTYTVASVVRKGLMAAGFRLRRHPGCGGKKEVLQGLKPLPPGSAEHSDAQ
jgi:tRNA U34 5-methylaminomethyl-2-thiouridine-forming methyltransferase MnmC